MRTKGLVRGPSMGCHVETPTPCPLCGQLEHDMMEKRAVVNTEAEKVAHKAAKTDAKKAAKADAKKSSPDGEK